MAMGEELLGNVPLQVLHRIAESISVCKVGWIKDEVLNPLIGAESHRAPRNFQALRQRGFARSRETTYEDEHSNFAHVTKFA